jgi:non-homologous end joining protein Ku
MIPFQVDPSWYEKYWWREPTSRRLSAFALLRRGLERPRRCVYRLLTVATERIALLGCQQPSSELLGHAPETRSSPKSKRQASLKLHQE